jgi:hypothetical protein
VPSLSIVLVGKSGGAKEGISIALTALATVTKDTSEKRIVGIGFMIKSRNYLHSVTGG